MSRAASRGDSRRDLTGLSFHHEDYLTRRAARWRAKTAGYIVETNLGALALGPVVVGASASIHGAYHSAAGSDRVGHLVAIQGDMRVRM
jgi:hypothetical protein